MDIQQVRSDLRKIKRLTHTSQAYWEMSERHRKMKEVSSCNSEAIEKVLEKIDIDKCVSSIAEMEARYIDVINQLSEIDKTIMIEHYLNGKPLWKIGQLVGYCDKSVQRRIKKIIGYIASKL